MTAGLGQTARALRELGLDSFGSMLRYEINALGFERGFRVAGSYFTDKPGKVNGFTVHNYL